MVFRFNPNTIKSYKISQKLSPKHAALGVAQSPYPIYRHRKACLSKQPPWRAAGDPHLARSRSRIRAPAPVGTLSYKISQKLSPKLAALEVAQLPYSIYRHGKACLSKQPLWRAAGDPRLARSRSRVRAPAPTGALCTLFFSTLPPSGDSFFTPSPPNPRKC